MTYPDKTVYPVASCNDKDFQNLMHVYMDAVLYPNITSMRRFSARRDGVISWIRWKISLNIMAWSIMR